MCSERDAAARRNMTDTFTEFMSESARQLNRIQGRTAPRRQASVLVSIDDHSGDSAPSTNITGGATTRSPNPIPAQIRRDNSEIIASTDDAWRTIEEALARNARTADHVRSTAAPPELRNELRRLRQLTQMRERLRTARESQGPLDSYSLGGIGAFRRASRNLHDPTHGLRTAGLAMSQDGRTLYCGTEEGIFEFRINLHQRKGLPAITPR